MRHFVLVLLLAVPLAADPLTEVRSSLARFTGRASIRATYEVQQSVLSEGKFGNDKYAGKATVELEGDADGVRVVYSRALLDQVEREESAKSRDPKQETPTVSALRRFTHAGDRLVRRKQVPARSPLATTLRQGC